MRSLTREEVRSVDRCAIEKLKIPGMILMENAGRNAADAIEHFWLTVVDADADTIAETSVAIVAGGGNNGGDGFVIARHLANRKARVVTFLVAKMEKIQGDAAINLAVIRNLGHDLRNISGDDIIDLAEELKKFDLIVDAAGGTGISGPLRGDIAMAVEQINNTAEDCGINVVSIDIPTGLDCDTGLAMGPTVRADLTITFVARKIGFDNPTSEEYTGEVQVVDIGIDPKAIEFPISN